MNEILEEYKGKILLILGLIFLVIIFLIISSCSKNKYIYTIKSNGNSKLPYIKIKNSDFDYINEDLENQYNEIINYNNESSFTYEYSVNKNIFSLLIIKKVKEKNSDFINEYYYSYNYDLNAKKFYNTDDILNNYAISKENVENTIKNELTNQYQKEVSEGYRVSQECNLKCFVNEKGYISIDENLITYIKKNKVYGYLNVSNASLYYDVNNYPKTKKIYKLN